MGRDNVEDAEDIGSEAWATVESKSLWATNLGCFVWQISHTPKKVNI